jgi:hypothetical protein
VRLRQGRKVGRTLYIQHAEEPSNGDVLVGMVDSRELAARIVAAFNGEPTPALRTELYRAYQAGQRAALRDGAIGYNPYGVE